MRARLSTFLGRVAIVALAAAVTACSDTTGASPAHFTPTSAPVATATPGPTATPLPSTTTSTVSTTAATTFALIGEGGYTELLSLPIASAAVPVTETISSGAPGGVTPFSAARRVAAASHGLFANSTVPLAARSASAATATALAYLDISTTATTSLSFSGTFSAAFTLPTIASGTVYNIAVYDGNGGWIPDPHASTQSGNTVTFSFTAAGFTVQSGSPLIFALYSAPPGPELTPSTLTFDATAPGLPQTIDINEPGNTAAYAVTIACTAATNPNASPSPDPSASPTADPNAFVAEFSDFTTSTTAAPVTGEANVSIIGGDQPGSCTVTATDTNGLTGTATVNVDETDAGLYSIHRVKH